MWTGSQPPPADYSVNAGVDGPGTGGVRIGIIGAENSHAAEYGRIFNKERAFPGMEVVGICGETEEFAQTAAREGDIPWVANDPSEFLGRIDALIVDHRHAKYHL